VICIKRGETAAGVLTRAVALIFVVGLLAAGSASADVPVSVSSWPTPTAAAAPDGIVLGPDGNLWFTEFDANKIGQITPAGQITEFGGLTAGSEPAAITAGPDGALWFVQPGTNDVGRISTGGAVTEVSIAVGTSGCETAGSGPVGIASGSDGDLWVTEDRNSPGQIAQIDPSGDAVTQHCPGYSMPYAIVPGSDGALWFTYGEGDVGRITTAGTSSAIPTVEESSALMPIVVGPDHDFYIGISDSPSEVEQLTTGDVARGFDIPSGSTANVERLGAGPDGQIWLAGGGALTSMSTSGAFEGFDGLYPSTDAIAGIAAGPSDTLWLTDSTASAIYRVTLGTPQVAAQLSPASSIGTTSATIAGQLLSAGNVPQNVSYQFQYGPSSAYGSSTPSQSTTATLAGSAVSAILSGLQPATTYHYRLEASGCAPSSCSAQSTDGTFTTAATPPPAALTPILGQSVVVEAISGKIRVRPRGARQFVVLTAGELIPVGSEVDSRHGKVEIESALGAGQVASGIFGGGLFTVSQPPGATVTVLKLDSDFKSCHGPRASARATIASAARKPSHKVVNQVFGTAHGHYTTRGHYAAAADEGTAWQVADRCDGTYVAVTVGRVHVTDLVRHRTFALSAPRHYLARPR
jgi:virginiamycin B lyase